MKEQRVKCLVHFQKHVKKLYRKYFRKFTYILPVHIQCGPKKGFGSAASIQRDSVYSVRNSCSEPFWGLHCTSGSDFPWLILKVTFVEKLRFCFASLFILSSARSNLTSSHNRASTIGNKQQNKCCMHMIN